MEKDIESLLEEAWARRREANYQEARHLVNEAHQLCSEDDHASLGRIFHIYMQFESDHGNPSKALDFCSQSLNHYKKTGNQNKIAHSTRHIADLERRLGQQKDSEQHYREAIRIYRSDAHTVIGDLANALRGFGLLLEQQQNFKEALSIWEETKELYRSCQIQAGVYEANQKIDFLEGKLRD